MSYRVVELPSMLLVSPTGQILQPKEESSNTTRSLAELHSYDDCKCCSSNCSISGMALKARDGNGKKGRAVLLRRACFFETHGRIIKACRGISVSHVSSHKRAPDKRRELDQKRKVANSW
jgi:Fe-S-cluster-containing hydrogenase component 2